MNCTSRRLGSLRPNTRSKGCSETWSSFRSKTRRSRQSVNSWEANYSGKKRFWMHRFNSEKLKRTRNLGSQWVTGTFCGGLEFPKAPPHRSRNLTWGCRLVRRRVRHQHPKRRKRLKDQSLTLTLRMERKGNLGGFWSMPINSNRGTTSQISHRDAQSWLNASLKTPK